MTFKVLSNQNYSMILCWLSYWRHYCPHGTGAAAAAPEWGMGRMKQHNSLYEDWPSSLLKVGGRDPIPSGARTVAGVGCPQARGKQTPPGKKPCPVCFLGYSRMLEHLFSLEIPAHHGRWRREEFALITPWWVREDPRCRREESRAEWSSLLLTQFSAIPGSSEGC